MAVGRNRNAQLIIDENAIYHNVREERKRLGEGTEMFMVVKANGYGHGAVQVARSAEAAGATGFCVAILDEAIELREAGFEEPILVLGITDIEDIPLISKYNISVTVSSSEWLKEADQLAADLHLQCKIKVHLALDTGMGRIGLQTPEEVRQFVAVIGDLNERFEFEGVYTHFATADESDDSYFDYQLSNFKKLMSAIPEKPRYVHVANSATSLWHKVSGANMIRYGVAGYGLNPSGTMLEEPFQLQPALSFTSELVFVKKLKKGCSVGYGATYTASEDEWIGTIPVGYADGISRRMQGFSLLVDGEWCPIVGRVCMDQIMVRLPHQEKIGMKVTLVGENGGKNISLQQVAEYCGTIHYEIACGYSERLPRVYQSHRVKL